VSTDCRGCGAPFVPEMFDCPQCGASYGVPRPAISRDGPASDTQAGRKRGGVWRLVVGVLALLLLLAIGGAWLARESGLLAPQVLTAEGAPEDAMAEQDVDLGMPRIVVLPTRTNSARYQVGDTSLGAAELAGIIRGSLEERLIASNRFTILDRQFSQEVLDELAQIDFDNGSGIASSHWGDANVADLLVVPEIVRFEYRRRDRELRASDRILSSYSGGGCCSLDRD
jgi:hypothetical protein